MEVKMVLEYKTGNTKTENEAVAMAVSDVGDAVVNTVDSVAWESGYRYSVIMTVTVKSEYWSRNVAIADAVKRIGDTARVVRVLEFKETAKCCCADESVERSNL